MYHLFNNISLSSNVSFAAVGYFVSKTKKCMVTAGDNWVRFNEIVGKETYKLVLFKEYIIDGTITGISRISSPGDYNYDGVSNSKVMGSLDKLLIATSNAKCSIVRFNTDTEQFITESLHNYENFEQLHKDTFLMTSKNGIRMDPEYRCAALPVFCEYMAILTFSTGTELLGIDDYSISSVSGATREIGTDMEPSFSINRGNVGERQNKISLASTALESTNTGNVQGRELGRKIPQNVKTRSFVLKYKDIDTEITNVIDFQFLNGFSAPTIIVLYETTSGCSFKLTKNKKYRKLVIISVDIVTHDVVKLGMVDHVDLTCYQIIPTKSKYVQCLVVGTNVVTLVNKGFTLSTLGINKFATVTMSPYNRYTLNTKISLEGTIVRQVVLGMAEEEIHFLLALKSGDLHILKINFLLSGNILCSSLSRIGQICGETYDIVQFVHRKENLLYILSRMGIASMVVSLSLEEKTGKTRVAKKVVDTLALESTAEPMGNKSSSDSETSTINGNPNDTSGNKSMLDTSEKMPSEATQKLLKEFPGIGVMPIIEDENSIVKITIRVVIPQPGVVSDFVLLNDNGNGNRNDLTQAQKSSKAENASQDSKKSVGDYGEGLQIAAVAESAEELSIYQSEVIPRIVTMLPLKHQTYQDVWTVQVKDTIPGSKGEGMDMTYLFISSDSSTVTLLSKGFVFKELQESDFFLEGKTLMVGLMNTRNGSPVIAQIEPSSIRILDIYGKLISTSSLVLPHGDMFNRAETAWIVDEYVLAGCENGEFLLYKYDDHFKTLQWTQLEIGDTKTMAVALFEYNTMAYLAIVCELGSLRIYSLHDQKQVFINPNLTDLHDVVRHCPQEYYHGNSGRNTDHVLAMENYLSPEQFSDTAINMNMDTNKTDSPGIEASGKNVGMEIPAMNFHKDPYAMYEQGNICMGVGNGGNGNLMQRGSSAFRIVEITAMTNRQNDLFMLLRTEANDLYIYHSPMMETCLYEKDNGHVWKIDRFLKHHHAFPFYCYMPTPLPRKTLWRFDNLKADCTEIKSGVFVAGVKPAWLFFTQNSRLPLIMPNQRLHGWIYGFCEFSSEICRNGFIYITEKQELILGTLYSPLIEQYRAEPSQGVHFSSQISNAVMVSRKLIKQHPKTAIDEFNIFDQQEPRTQQASKAKIPIVPVPENIYNDIHMSHIAFQHQTGICCVAKYKRIPFILPPEEGIAGEDNEMSLASVQTLAENVDFEMAPVSSLFVIQILSSKYNYYVMDSFMLKPTEVITSFTIERLSSRQHATGYVDCLVIGTFFTRGEDRAAKGRLLLFELVKIVEDPETPHLSHKLKFINENESSGFVSCVTSILGNLAVFTGMKVMIYKLSDNGCPDGMAFLDLFIYANSCSVVKNYLIIGDVYKSVQFVVFQEEPPKLISVGKDFFDLPVSSVGWTTRDKLLNILVGDRDKNLHSYQYSPTDPTSFGGQKLLKKESVFLGERALKFFPVKVEMPSILRWSTLTRSQLKSESSVYATIIACNNGSVFIIVPIGEKPYRILYLVYLKLIGMCGSFAGLNIQEYRACKQDFSKRVSRVKTLSMIDANYILIKFNSLSPDKRVFLAKAVASTVPRIYEYLQLVTSGINI